MNFKDLMKLSYDLSEEVKQLNISMSNMIIINDFNEIDNKRFFQLKEKSTKATMKALELNNIVLNYVAKKHHRELNKPKKIGVKK